MLRLCLNSRIIVPWILIFLCTHICLSQRSSVLLKSCETPDGNSGSCTKLKECDVLNELLQRKEEPEVRERLRKSHCGFEGRDVVVCCPLNSTVELIELPVPPRIPSELPSGLPHHVPSSPSTPGSTTLQQLELPFDEFLLCGKSNVTRIRIVDGQEAGLGSWPWMAALGYSIKNEPGIHYLCGGTLIDDRHVLTAAHCIVDINISPSEVRLGDLDLNESVDDGAFPISVPVQNVVTHEQYRRYPKIINDIAMITLRHSVHFNKLIRPLCLPSAPALRRNNFERKLFYIIGWGRIAFNNYTPPTMLREAQVPPFNNNKCKEKYGDSPNALIDDRVICAGGNGKDTCQGDSGGPLIAYHEGTFYLVGIVSYGQKCGDVEHPGVYTKVSTFLDWINDHRT